MAEETVAASKAEVNKLTARIKELEEELKAARASDKEDDDSSRFTDYVNDIKDSEFDMVGRVFRGLTMAAAEATKLSATTVSNLANDIISSNSKRDDGDRTVSKLITRLPEDIVSNLSKAIDDLSRVPSKAADRYSSAYNEGRKAKTNK